MSANHELLPTEDALSDPWATARPLLASLAGYRRARQTLLEHLGLGDSNRDPLAEASEHLVAALLGGTLATNRVQKGWDLVTPDGQRVQVRYLANPGDRWVNEHLVDFRGDGCDRYALVVFEALQPKAVLVFSGGQMETVADALGKRHGHRDVTLQLTRRNYLHLLDDPAGFRAMGVDVFVVPWTD